VKGIGEEFLQKNLKQFRQLDAEYMQQKLHEMLHLGSRIKGHGRQIFIDPLLLDPGDPKVQHDRDVAERLSAALEKIHVGVFKAKDESLTSGTFRSWPLQPAPTTSRSKA
jgi:hypothetical protein